MVLEDKTPASAYKPRLSSESAAAALDAPPSTAHGARIASDVNDVDDASPVKGPLTRHLETVEKDTPGGAGGAWWGQADNDADDDSDADDLVGGGMGRAADDAAGGLPRLPFSAARTARGKLAGDGKCRCPVCLGEFERNDLVILSDCNHPFCAPCVEAWASRRARSCPLCKKEFTGRVG
jgi:hypothetical protein